MRKWIAGSLLGVLSIGPLTGQVRGTGESPTATPIRHVVVIFGENISFDHYFGSYPHALNLPGEPRFIAARDTPSVNGLAGALRGRNPNFLNVAGNGDDAANPIRLDRSQAATADEDHNYTAEQRAFDFGQMDLFPKYTGVQGSPSVKKRLATPKASPSQYAYQTKGLVMAYYDGNTVTALWNYAQRYALNDNSYGSTFGPSTPGALELISGQTNGVIDAMDAGSTVIDGGDGTYTAIGDSNPIGDVCSNTAGPLFRLSSSNIGQMLSRRGVTWGWFAGGFDLTRTNANGTTGCLRSTFSSVTHLTVRDYVPHHEPFQYYTATANPNHVRPTSLKMIGRDQDAARHQYDVEDFFAAVKAGNFPAVSFLKAPAFQNGHAGNSDPLDEQAFVVRVINFLEQQTEWKSTAVILAYDDSDGWYDHQMGPIVNTSSTGADALTGPSACGNGATALPGPNTEHAQGRCGYGPRLPLLVVSPYARRNYVDHSLTDQTSILRFIEDNWLGGERVGQGSFDAIAGSITGMFDFEHPRTDKYFLDPSTGLAVSR